MATIAAETTPPTIWRPHTALRRPSRYCTDIQSMMQMPAFSSQDFFMTYTVHSIATISTASAQKYIDQLAKHWAHKCEVTQQDSTTHVTFPFATVAMQAQDDHLQVHVSTATTEHLEKSKEVFMAHLDRFAFREAPITATWQDQPA